jgi:hypothetical protein
MTKLFCTFVANFEGILAGKPVTQMSYLKLRREFSNTKAYNKMLITNNKKTINYV